MPECRYCGGSRFVLLAERPEVRVTDLSRIEVQPVTVQSGNFPCPACRPSTFTEVGVVVAAPSDHALSPSEIAPQYLERLRQHLGTGIAQRLAIGPEHIDAHYNHDMGRTELRVRLEVATMGIPIRPDAQREPRRERPSRPVPQETAARPMPATAMEVANAVVAIMRRELQANYHKGWAVLPEDVERIMASALRQAQTGGRATQADEAARQDMHAEARRLMEMTALQRTEVERQAATRSGAIPRQRGWAAAAEGALRNAEPAGVMTVDLVRQARDMMMRQSTLDPVLVLTPEQERLMRENMERHMADAAAYGLAISRINADGSAERVPPGTMTGGGGAGGASSNAGGVGTPGDGDAQERRMIQAMERAGIAPRVAMRAIQRQRRRQT